MKFPLFIDLNEKMILVIGGGTIATRRVQTLLPFGACIQVIAPEISSELHEITKNKIVEWLPRRYLAGDCQTAYMVLCCTEDRVVNHSVYLEAKKYNCYWNISDCKEECNFYFPGIARKGEIVAGVTASGTDHKVARAVTRRIRGILEEEEF